MTKNLPAQSRVRGAVAALVRPVGPPPEPARRAVIADALLAAVLGVVGVYYALDSGIGASIIQVDGVVRTRDGAQTWVGAVLPMLGTTLPLALRRRYPLAVLWVVLAAGLLVPDAVLRMVFYCLIIATYSAVAYSPYQPAALLSLPAALVLLAPKGQPAMWRVPDEYVPALVLVPLAAAGYWMRGWRARAEEKQQRVAALERERAAELRRAAEQERARIARELHDVITHNVSMMVIQAGAARRGIEAAPDLAREALLAAESAGRAALTELRHTMGLLTMDDDGTAEPADLAPQPGLGRLATLVGRVREAGLPVTLTVTGTLAEVPPGAGLAAYRVVQEALTNTLKHATGAQAAVAVAYDGAELSVAVTDTGGPPGPAASSGNGRGLLGLRERLSMYGGTLHAGPTSDGGYRVRALIPLPPAESV
ncbi:histidine kinase [Streptomyces sp. NPDC051940]|uniref:sensor histidine kinase n=1 Tax=Streptomyces sp. NPDC051940 TaxID=3155675 RepID=UPI003425A6B1